MLLLLNVILYKYTAHNDIKLQKNFYKKKSNKTTIKFTQYFLEKEPFHMLLLHISLLFKALYYPICSYSSLNYRSIYVTNNYLNTISYKVRIVSY